MRGKPLQTCNESVAKPREGSFQVPSVGNPRFCHVACVEFTSLNSEDIQVTFE